MRLRHLAVLAMALGLLLVAASARAQDDSAFAALGSRLHAGDAVRVVDRDGARHTGTIVSISSDGLVITGRSGRQTFTAESTARVARLGDPVLNGALAGLIPGFLLGLQLPRATSEQRVNEGSGVKAGLITGLVGAAIGMAIDGARDGETDVYTAAAPPRVTLAPVIGRRAVGATASVRW